MEVGASSKIHDGSIWDARASRGQNSWTERNDWRAPIVRRMGAWGA